MGHRGDDDNGLKTDRTEHPLENVRFGLSDPALQTQFRLAQIALRSEIVTQG